MESSTEKKINKSYILVVTYLYHQYGSVARSCFTFLCIYSVLWMSERSSSSFRSTHGSW